MPEYTIGDLVARQWSLRLGGVPYSAARSTVTTAISKRSEAHFTLDLRFLAPLDLTAPVEFISTDTTEASQPRDVEPLFSGHVIKADLEDGLLIVDSEGARELAEATAGFWQANTFSPIEMVYALAREAGFSDDRIQIEGTGDLPEEVFAVDMLVAGLDIAEPIEAAGVSITPINDHKSLGAFRNLDPEILKAASPTARFRVYVSAELLYVAQSRGVGRISTVLDTLWATATYGLTHDPWRRPLRFDRNQLRARPSALPYVFVQGVATKRRWLRSLGGGVTSPHLDIGRILATWSRLLATAPDPEVARALRALRDAADDSRDPFDRCNAIFTALEYYAAASQPPTVISRSSLKSAKRAIKDLGIPPSELQRLLEVLSSSNNPPLLARVRHQATIDGVPMTDREWDLIKELRTARNGSVHGHGSQNTPSVHDLRWGVSFTSRLLLHRWAATHKIRRGV